MPSLSPPGNIFQGTGTLPRLFVGTSSMGSVMPLPFVSGPAERQAFLYLDRVLEIGCFAFDLAASYQLGGTERLFGAWMAARGHRERLFLVTKGALPLPIVSPHRLTAKDLSDDLHGSLRRLRTDYVDLYLLHRDDSSAHLEPVLDALTDFHRTGKIRAWGVSNWTVERIQEIDRLARAGGVPSLAASSPHFSLADWSRPPWPGTVSIAGDAQRKARDYYRRTGLPVLAWSPLGQGFFTTPQVRGNPRVYASRVNAERRQRAQELAQKHQLSAVQVALAYLLNQSFPVYPVVAASTVDKMQSNLAAAKLHLSEDELRWLESGVGSNLVDELSVRGNATWKS